jgi:hypothetical protein
VLDDISGQRQNQSSLTPIYVTPIYDHRHSRLRGNDGCLVRLSDFFGPYIASKREIKNRKINKTQCSGAACRAHSLQFNSLYPVCKMQIKNHISFLM